MENNKKSVIKSGKTVESIDSKQVRDISTN